MTRDTGTRSREPRNIVITGATDGMGKVAAKELARRGARLVVVSRNRDRCEAVTAECIADTGNPRVDYVVADLSTVRDVRRAAAGLLRASEDPLVMAIAGGGRFAEDIDFDDLQNERRYSKRLAIGKSSTLNELLTLEQARRHEGITFCNLGPGLVRTKTVMATPLARVLFKTIGRLFTRSPEAAGMDIAELALGGCEGGFYGSRLVPQQSTWAEAHPELGPTLWQKTGELLGDMERAARQQRPVPSPREPSPHHRHPT